MTDLTALTTPFGLLDPETQEALKAHGGPYETFMQKSWVGLPAGQDFSRTRFDYSYAVRVRPAPPQPRTIYLCEFQSGERSIHKTAIDATKAALAYGPGATVSEWREVLS